MEPTTLSGVVFMPSSAGEANIINFSQLPPYELCCEDASD